MPTRSRSFAFAALALLTFAGACGAGPDRVAQQFLDNLRNGEISSAMDLVSTESREAIGDAQVREHLRDRSEAYGRRKQLVLSAADSGLSSDGRSALLRLMGGQDAREQVGEVALIKEGSRWRIDLTPDMWR